MTQLTAHQVCIKGHPERGGEIIQWFVENGATSIAKGDSEYRFYFIKDDMVNMLDVVPNGYTLITFDQFLELRGKREIVGYKKTKDYPNYDSFLKPESFVNGNSVGHIFKDKPAFKFYSQWPDYFTPIYAEKKIPLNGEYTVTQLQEIIDKNK